MKIRLPLFVYPFMLFITLFGGLRQVNAQINRPDADIINNYEVLIESKLSAYIHERDFMVKVGIQQDTIVEFAPTAASGFNQQFGTLPGIPDATGFYTPAQTLDTLTQEASFKKVYRVRKYLKTEIIVSNRYDSIDMAFIKDLVKMVIPYNESKGDRIVIKSRKFPKWKPETDMEANPELDPLLQTPEDLAASNPVSGGPVYNNSINNNESKATTDSVSYAAAPVATSVFAPSNLPILLLGILLVLVVGLILYLILTRQKSKKKKKHFDENPLKEKQEKGAIVLPNPPAEQINTEEEKKLFTSYFIKSPKAISEIIENELVSKGNVTLIKYAKAISSVNHELSLLLEPYMNLTTYLSLGNKITEFQNSNEQAIQEIHQILEKLRLLHVSDGQGLFSFLSRINDKQLLFLLRDESSDIIAVTLAQLKSDRAQNILQYFDENKKSEILTQMGLIELQPTRFFKEAATKLTDKLPEFEGMKDLSIDGISGIMNILDNLSDREQAALIAKMEEKSPLVAKDIKKLFIGFENIIHVEDAVLDKAIQNIETNHIIEALSGYSKQIQDKVIKLRPSREQIILRSQLEENNEPIANGIATRKKIVLSIRHQLKNNDKQLY